MLKTHNCRGLPSKFEDTRFEPFARLLSDDTAHTVATSKLVYIVNIIDTLGVEVVHLR